MYFLGECGVTQCGIVRGDSWARYIISATGTAGPVEFQQRLTIGQALIKARELRDAHFSHITLRNELSGLKITDLEALMSGPQSMEQQ